MPSEYKNTNVGGLFYDFFGNSTAQNIYKDSVAYQRESLYIAVPCTIENTDKYETHQVVDARILINDYYSIMQQETLQQITMKDVFVRLQGGGGFEEKHPVSVGDKAAMYFSHKDLTEYLAGDGSAVDILISDRGKLKDCWIELGFGTKSNNYKPSKTDLIQKGPNSTQTTKPDGTRIYENNNVTVTEFANGDVEIVNSAGAKFKLRGSEIKMNGATITSDGDVVTASGISLDNHTHPESIGSQTGKPS